MFKATNKRFLFIFDFDHTIVNLNTDTYIQRVLQNQKLPQSVIDTAQISWGQFVQSTLNYISDQNITVEQMKQCIQTMQLTPGFDQIFDFIKQNQQQIDSVIVSDSNNFFIESILEKQNAQDIFKNIFTNSTIIDSQNQRIQLRPYHSHQCPRKSCPPNLCKSIALSEGLNWEQNIKSLYQRIYYFGDGGNDYCPLKLLSKQDVVFVRKDFKLDTLIQSNPVECETFIWENGNQIVDSKHFRELFEQEQELI